MTGTPPRFSTEGLSKDYVVRVLDGVQFELRAGEIHALVGANGAGKSTLCKMISGLVPLTEGQMLLNGVPYSPADKRSAESLGVQIVQQELNLIPTLSVAENLLLGRYPQRWGVIDRRELQRRARTALDRFGLTDIATDQSAESLGVGQQQMLEIAAALDRKCELLILDEPTAALSAGETERLFARLDELRAQGVGIIYISHRLDEIARIADRLTVLRDGKYVSTHAVSEFQPIERVVDLMTGETQAVQHALQEHTNHSQTQTLLRVDGMTGGPVQEVSFSVQAGERYGIAGLVGAGRTELLRLIFGADRATRGDVFLRGESVPRRFSHPHEAVAAKMAMVTEDRKQNGLLLSQSIRVNTTLPSLDRLAGTAGVIDRQREASVVRTEWERLGIRARDMEQSVGTLSGGNQQKVAVAKWLLKDADVFLFDEPTRGIDVAARRKIHQLFDELARQGKALVIVSSDLEELFETCDRIGVMSAGRLVSEYGREEWSYDAIMQDCFAGYASQEKTKIGGSTR
ncbi:sugar ABC transporter ATP-binding protein [Gimesia chilikensis]|uniref:sugar ABC transporter ATP-binding protein n=1 Tax=Gimesia chilikensis TaxID=2605989 RepID=UPI0011EF61E4|nr:sugar ABC transporter ATP-binding protein [Gimesia chilikensis]KAA0131750.1 sugar ABC transporter ATP-binding protein [Gimesia chilikensis]